MLELQTNEVSLAGSTGRTCLEGTEVGPEPCLVEALVLVVPSYSFHRLSGPHSRAV